MAEQTQDPVHIVIVGAGFGGLAAVRGLQHSQARITVIDKTNHHLFQPLLYQVAMAGLSPAEIAYPIRAIFREERNVRVVLAEVTAIDLTKKVVETTYDHISYDYLIIAAGAQTNYYGHPEWSDSALGLKDIDDALEIRRRVLVAFEEAERERDQLRQRKLLTFVVIGAGPTGVELAGSLAELARHALASDFRNISPSSASIILLEGMDRVLPPFVPQLSSVAAEQLKKMGVEIRTGVKVTNIDGHGVHIGDELIPCHTVLWCAGVAASPLAKAVKGATLDRTGRILVKEDLSLDGHANAFAIGDVATFLHQGGKPLPGLAPVAMQQGRCAAKNILNDITGRSREKFVYVDRGTLATIGRSAAVADFGKTKMTGFWAWLSWLFIHIMFLIGFRNRIFVMLDWIMSYLTYERGSRLITGHRMEAGAPGKRLTKEIMRLDNNERVKVVEELRKTISGTKPEEEGQRKV